MDKWTNRGQSCVYYKMLIPTSYHEYEMTASPSNLPILPSPQSLPDPGSMQAVEENFCLRWANHQNFLTGAARQLRREPEFHDVTLACDDNQIVQAHKVMLAAGSPVFRDLLRKHPHPHPLIYIRGVQSSQLEEVIIEQSFSFYLLSLLSIYSPQLPFVPRC